ncbi:unnamed protein product, partial [Amoebophrya sp. A25]
TDRYRSETLGLQTQLVMEYASFEDTQQIAQTKRLKVIANETHAKALASAQQAT